MDPNVTYSQLIHIVRQIELDRVPVANHAEAVELAVEHAENLSEWLDRGGFAPRGLDPHWRTRTAEALAKISSIAF